MSEHTATPTSHATHFKAVLVDVGMVALAAGDWRLVETITTLIQRRGWGGA
jgi:hypothetical protein